MQDTAGAKSNDAKPTDYDLDCPEEFRAILHTFSAAQIHDAYPAIHMYDDPHARDYLSFLMFLRRYHGYKFAWIMENDVRYTGRNWGVFLNNVLNGAIAASGNEQVPIKLDDSWALLPSADVKLPDFLSFRNGEIPTSAPISNDRKPRDTERWKLANNIPNQVVIFGVSRQYVDVLHEHSVEGNGGYIEEFILTLAVEEKMSVVAVPLPGFGGASIHCCFYVGTEYYTDWFQRGQCRHPNLVHPVKNDNASIWGDNKVLFPIEAG